MEGLVKCVREAQAGNKQAFDLLYRNFYNLVRKIALNQFHSESDVDDVSQIIWTRVLEHIKTLRECAAFPGWIRSIARNTCLMIKMRNQPLVLQYVETAIDEEPVNELIRREHEVIVNEGIGTLGKLDRQIINMFYYERMMQKQISKRLKVPLGTVKRRLHTARKRAKKVFQEIS